MKSLVDLQVLAPGERPSASRAHEGLLLSVDAEVVDELNNFASFIAFHKIVLTLYLALNSRPLRGHPSQQQTCRPSASLLTWSFWRC